TGILGTCSDSLLAEQEHGGLDNASPIAPFERATVLDGMELSLAGRVDPRDGADHSRAFTAPAQSRRQRRRVSEQLGDDHTTVQPERLHRRSTEFGNGFERWTG